MSLKKSKLQYNPKRDLYWAKIIISSQNGKKTSILFCASSEYIQKNTKLLKISAKSLDDWYQKIIQSWEAKGGRIFKQGQHLDVRTLTSQGEKNSRKFLTEESLLNTV